MDGSKITTDWTLSTYSLAVLVSSYPSVHHCRKRTVRKPALATVLTRRTLRVLNNRVTETATGSLCASISLEPLAWCGNCMLSTVGTSTDIFVVGSSGFN
jgi:hypothetical protein